MDSVGNTEANSSLNEGIVTACSQVNTDSHTSPILRRKVALILLPT